MSWWVRKEENSPCEHACARRWGRVFVCAFARDGAEAAAAAVAGAQLERGAQSHGWFSAPRRLTHKFNASLHASTPSQPPIQYTDRLPRPQPTRAICRATTQRNRVTGETMDARSAEGPPSRTKAGQHGDRQASSIDSRNARDAHSRWPFRVSPRADVALCAAETTRLAPRAPRNIFFSFV